MTAPAPVDTKELRAIAEAALADSERAWTYVDGPLVGDVHVETRPDHPGRSRIRVDPNAVGPFVAAASPGTVLALLDEVDGARAPEAHWECQQKIDALEEQLAAAIAAREKVERHVPAMLANIDRLTKTVIEAPEFLEAVKIATRAERDQLRAGLTEALDLLDATWCPEQGHAPRPEQLARAEALRKLVSS